MPKTEKKVSSRKRKQPATSPEARENQLIALAVDLAEKQLSEGTASAQVITHYLKLGTTKERLEKEKMVAETEMIKAKAEAARSNIKTEELYEKALSAMRSYSGMELEDEE